MISCRFELDRDVLALLLDTYDFAVVAQVDALVF